jgi:hypothetical protein
MSQDEGAAIVGICPHFIVEKHRASVDYYRDKLGFIPIMELPKDDPALPRFRM